MAGRHCGIAALMLVAAAVAATLLAVPSAVRAQVPDDFPGFRVQGRHLYDTLGEEVILAGVNKMVIYTDRDGLPSFPEIAKTGANAVRIVWLTEGSAEELDTVITNAINNKLIPIVDCHDSTGKWDVHHWQDLNPVVPEGLVQMAMGTPAAIYHGGLLHASVRYFDPSHQRPGLPTDVAALVGEFTVDGLTLSLVNTNSLQAREVLVQAGGYGEHRFVDVRPTAMSGPLTR